MIGTEYFAYSCFMFSFFSKNFNFLFFVLNDFTLSVLLNLIMLCSYMLVLILSKLIIKLSLHFCSLDVRLLDKFFLFSYKWECRIFTSQSSIPLLLGKCPLTSANLGITLFYVMLLIKSFKIYPINVLKVVFLHQGSGS